MYYVMQKYVGWVGIVDGNECTSGACVFYIANNKMLEQLVPHVPLKHELIELLKYLKSNLPERTDYIKFVEDSLNGKAKGYTKQRTARQEKPEVTSRTPEEKRGMYQVRS